MYIFKIIQKGKSHVSHSRATLCKYHVEFLHCHIAYSLYFIKYTTFPSFQWHKLDHIILTMKRNLFLQNINYTQHANDNFRVSNTVRDGLLFD